MVSNTTSTTSYWGKLLVAFLLLCQLLATPMSAYAEQAPLAEDPYSAAISVDLADGNYLVAVSLEGGTGRASITSPAQLIVSNGKAMARIEWSSPHYDYMLVDGMRYLPVNTEGNSVFEIPVLSLEEAFDVVGDTTAMGEPHEIDYQLTFDASSIVADNSEQLTKGQTPGLLQLAVAGVAVVGAATAFFLSRTGRGVKTSSHDS